MSKWRPSENCLYVIPDIHGFCNELKLLLDEIIPLQQSDKLIFLGDYIDRGPDTPGVIELLVNLKKQYKDSIVFLRGNHEEMLLSAFGLNKKINPHNPMQALMWLETGGASTISQYRDGGKEVPQEHIEFIKNTEYYHIHDKYLFVHAGYPDHNAPIEEQNVDEFVWDRTLFEFVKRGGKLNSKYTVVTGHNYKGPFVSGNFMMLDCSAQRKLIMVELNSMQMCLVEYNSGEIKKEILKETLHKKPAFRRV